MSGAEEFFFIEIMKNTGKFKNFVFRTTYSFKARSIHQTGYYEIPACVEIVCVFKHPCNKRTVYAF